jgi:TolB-like protein
MGHRLADDCGAITARSCSYCGGFPAQRVPPEHFTYILAMPGDGESENIRAAPAGRVFISYASYDDAVAGRICAALEAAGFPCWIAPRDVRAGEPYAAAIVEAINACRLVVLILTKNAIESPHVLREVERASSKKRSILSIRLDGAELPPELEYFLSANHWLDAASGNIDSVLPALIESVRGRDGGSPARAATVSHAPAAHASGRQAAAGHSSAAAPTTAGSTTGRKQNWVLIAIGAVVAVALVYLVVDKIWGARNTATVITASGSSAPSSAASTAGDASAKSAGGSAAFTPPPHSIAVLPFVNMSGDPKQDYFSDGLSEELLNSLASIRDLRVAARTSSFFFKGKDVDLSDVARKLNVGAVLEGSVRKAGDQVRITAQLINAVTGYHLWSQTYDRDLKDILKLQTEIATAVTKALEATLLADAAATIELGGTTNPQAFDAYLRAKGSAVAGNGRSALLDGIASVDEAIRLDPGFAKAYAWKALAENGFAEYYGVGDEIREHFQRARAAAGRALELAPDLGEAHSAMARVLSDGFYDYHGALAEHERALALSPNDSGVLMRAAWFYADIGRTDAAATLARRGVSLDQLNPAAYRSLAVVMDDLHQYRDAIEAANRALSLNPKDVRQAALRGLALVHLGEYEAAVQSCNVPPLDWESHLCLAIAYDKLHRRQDADAQLQTMTKELGDSSAYQYAEIYAQWGDIPKSLDWIESAYRLKDPGITAIDVDEFLAPIRKEPRLQAIDRKVNLPH